MSALKRPRQPMPPDIRHALDERGLWDDYTQRPAYQQNDYLAWISRAVRPETRQKRLLQMLDELATGGIYMKMDHPPSTKSNHPTTSPQK